MNTVPLDWISLFQQHPSGVSVALLQEVTQQPERTLQRKLAALVEAGVLQRQGSRRGARYLLRAANTETCFPFSAEAMTLCRQVHLPQRPKVGYQRAFLDAYVPNQSAYLDDMTRQRLMQCGSVGVDRKLAGTYAREIYSRLLIDLSWNSSRLEGNTYSLLETQRLLEQGIAADGKSGLETQMLLNHKNAIAFLVDSAEDIDFNLYTLLNLHGLLSDGLLGNAQSCGRLRQIAVQIGGSSYTPLAIPQQLEECFRQALDTAKKIENPFEQAFFIWVHLPYLQAFEDVNKRVSRLAANIPFIRHNLCPLSFVDVPEQPYIDGLLAVYELNRIEALREVFVWAYERSAQRYGRIRQTVSEPDPFRRKHYTLLFSTVSEVIRSNLSRETATPFIRQQAQNLQEAEQARFVALVEEELLAVHPGNSVRFRVTAGEFEHWFAHWQTTPKP